MIFQRNQKLFHQTLNTNDKLITINNTPKPSDIEKFWKNVWSKPIYHNNAAAWLNKERNKTTNIPYGKLKYRSRGNPRNYKTHITGKHQA